MISDDEIRQLEELEREADEAPWDVTDLGESHAAQFNPRWSIEAKRQPLRSGKPYISWPVAAQCWGESRADADFIAAARNALPKLIAAYRMQERVVEAARNLVTMCQEDECFTDPSDPGPYAALKNTELQLAALGAARAVVRVLTHGANKYGVGNWQHVPEARDRYFAAAMRHLIAWREGQLVDLDSGLPHLAHAAASLLFLLWFDDSKSEVK
jgi:hypothetical protein